MFFFHRSRDGEPLGIDRRVEILSHNGRHRLRISRVTISDEGLYTCTATSSAGTEAKTAKLTIRGRCPVEVSA